MMNEFCAAFGVWDVARPYVHLMVDKPEMRLIVGMQGQAMTVDEVAALLSMSREEASAFLARCYSRYIVNKTVERAVTTYSPADFGARLNHFAKYENWDDIPAQDRRAIDRHFLDEFIARHRSNVERKMQGLVATDALPNDAVMLLHEVEEMIDAATHVVVQPCDCRRLGQNCEYPVETCIWMDESALGVLDRGHGRRVSREEAKELLRWADKKGLMHTADGAWREHGLHAICNCCACDCYPFRAGQELGSKGVWPRSRHVAVHDQEACNFCGACVKRCHFEAFYHDGSTVEVEGRVKQDVLFDAAKCWGCGLCAHTCPTGAIVMEELDSVRVL
jgi:Pyruvate/2-oxoacid:ferredoxin oxidoreductase delta subunit